MSLTTISFLDLILVFFVAQLFGFWQATVISVLAVLSLDYLFTPPLFHFSISSPQDWISLATFELAALLISRLSARELRSSREAALHRTNMEQLYELSRSSLLLDLHQPPGTQLIVLILRTFKLEAVALFDAHLGREDFGGEWAENDPNIAKECYLKGATLDNSDARIAVRILRGSTGPVGAIALRGEFTPLVVDAVSMLAALALDRYQSFEKEERAEDARRSEQLRAAVMDALAHEFKTPLSTVHTAVSAMLEFGGLRDNQAELVSLIEDQTARMIALCTKLLLTARLESGKMPLASDEVHIEALLQELVAAASRGEEVPRIRLNMMDPGLSIYADRALLGMILTQYIENARKYSTPETPIQIAVRRSSGEMLFSVHNIGPAIPIEDRERVFDRFYRSPGHVESIPGTGIGLSIVRKAAIAHKGHVWVVSDESEGTTFFLMIPIDGGKV